jgi:hypothetical protein
VATSARPGWPCYIGAQTAGGASRQVGTGASRSWRCVRANSYNRRVTFHHIQLLGGEGKGEKGGFQVSGAGCQVPDSTCYSRTKQVALKR